MGKSELVLPNTAYSPSAGQSRRGPLSNTTEEMGTEREGDTSAANHRSTSIAPAATACDKLSRVSALVYLLYKTHYVEDF